MRAPVDKTSAFVTGWRARLRSAAFEGPERVGLRLERLEDTATFVDDTSTTSPELMNAAASVPGMISHRRGMYYYWLAYAAVPGDVIELGCWQGRSTTFLAQACKDTGNGVVHVVDTFRGNPGNEAAYQVAPDLQRSFEGHMQRLGLADHIRVYPGRSQDRAAEVTAAAAGARMLVVDAEHTYDAVHAELDLYADALAIGGILAFDDYSKDFPGVAQAVNEHIQSSGRYATPMQDRGLLVARRVA
jgi:predicted O-methyltransferase YrrM